LEIICHLGIIATAEGDYDRAKGRFEESLDLATRLSSTRGTYEALHLLGELEQHLGDRARATELLNQSMELARQAGDRRRQNLILGGLADVALAEHDLDRAASLYRQSLQYGRDVEDWRSAAYDVAGLAVVAAIQADVERAGRLWGGLSSLEQALGWHMTDFDFTRYNDLISTYRDAEPIRFSAAAERGRRMSTDQIIDCALADGLG
jgi:non-specific serine/threonine protein kinase